MYTTYACKLLVISWVIYFVTVSPRTPMSQFVHLAIDSRNGLMCGWLCKLLIDHNKVLYFAKSKHAQLANATTD